MSSVLQKRYKSPYPALNHHRRDEPDAMDTIFSDTPAIDGGETVAHFFVGTKTMLTDAYGMKSKKHVPQALMDHITRRGAPTKLISDRAKGPNWA